MAYVVHHHASQLCQDILHGYLWPQPGWAGPSTLRCLWVSSVFASARDPRCTRRRSWRHSWHVGDHPREGVETLREHVRTMSMIKVARALGQAKTACHGGSKHLCFFHEPALFFYVSTIIAYCFLLKSDRRAPEKQPQLSMSKPSLSPKTYHTEEPGNPAES